MKHLTKTNALVIAGTFVTAGAASLAAGQFFLAMGLTLTGVAVGGLTIYLSRRTR